MNKLLIALLGMSLAGAALAKLPPLSPEAQAKADEAKQKTAWSDKVAAYQLCQAQDRVAASYRKAKGAQPKAETPAAPAAAAPAPAAPAPAASATAPATAAAAPAIPPCQDPGPYVAAAASAKVGVADSLPVPAAGKPPAPAEVKK
ncbi:hypothetical protein KTQ42_04320|uniref:hypothetical protein n=1 Tax=Noviherbaspirillum sp. L7-7A TaxID=2850560 RepID=UPI001C2BB5D5|nr:hypothetical protein [Noviherbaspirillum sp. L7-7A]MBV0878524.1 hypothetical protein [Noviherbaspirillum sp. L7-7A]